MNNLKKAITAACVVGLSGLAGQTVKAEAEWNAIRDTTELMQIESFRSDFISVYYGEDDQDMAPHGFEWVVAKLPQSDERSVFIYPNPMYILPGQAWVTYTPLQKGYVTLDEFVKLHMGKDWHAQSMIVKDKHHFDERFNRLPCKGIIFPVEMVPNSIKYWEVGK